MIYLDNAATTLKKPACVIDAVAEAMNSLGNAGRGVHDASMGAARTVFGVRSSLAEFFGASSPAQVAFTPNSTAALNIAIKGIINPGDHVITTVMEHNSVLRPLYQLEEKGVELSVVGCDEWGNLKYEDVESQIRENTRAIVCTCGSNLTGNKVDIEKVAKVARENRLILIVDASQTAGVFPSKIEEDGIDVLCFTGHKSMLGPQGTGGLVVKEGMNIRPLLSGGSGVQTYSRSHPQEMPTALEAGTLNGHGIAGLGAALQFIMETGMDEIREKEQKLMWRFYRGVSEIPGVKIYGDFRDESKERCPIVALNIKDYDSSEVSDVLLMDYDIATRPGAHCAPLMHKALGTVEQGVVRFSFSYSNSMEDVEAAVNAIKQLAAE